MNFCPNCAAPLHLRVPPGDHLPRHVCDACGAIHYENPRVVAGCVPEWEGRILLCRRAIEPRRGYWTTPSGFMELGESLAQAAAREAREEALADVEIATLVAVVSVVHAGQLHVNFRGRLRSPDFGVGSESLEVGLYEEAAIPWDDIAFESVRFTLRCWFADRAAGSENVHFYDIVRRPAGRSPGSP